jgi:acyl-CoA reductase-like NAD-dependent aldehyde dehydrogenase
VVNILTGARPEVAHTLASAQEVNALHLTGIADSAQATALERTAAATLKRVLRPGLDPADSTADAYKLLTSQVETTTVWHSLGT